MNIRYAVFLLLLTTSCDFFLPSKKGGFRAFDTIVDFTKVDVSPAFNRCRSLSEEEKSKCFREEIHERFAKSLQEYSFVIQEGIEEEVLIDLLINAEGKFILKNITASKDVNQQLPELDSILKSTIEKLPQIQPATKRGIPVVTQYHLPLKIQTE
ncbi:hypothetical protein C8N26_0053 [Tenacibaculum lutimaris]|uniref:TonB-like protein n=1 Tax=Tenacibaculum lutimaris TaxID=285258 RepID=A0A420E3J7_9FLAO|nr:hypothetical protein [Tenacibaculum lutimaris]RKF04668.1 hypothetical protein C8N26_0053 [Tenacibaculum lutimaris]